MVALVKEKLSGAGISIVSEGAIGHDKIDELQLVDNHYGAIASKAVQLKPRELNVPEKGKRAFAEAFGLTWEDALAKGMVFNAADACGHLGVDAAGLDKKWSTLKRGQDMIKFGGGFYAGQVDGLFVINGFYMSMRSKYTQAPASIHYFVTEFDPAQLSWTSFEKRFWGEPIPTPPSQALSAALCSADGRSSGCPLSQTLATMASTGPRRRWRLWPSARIGSSRISQRIRLRGHACSGHLYRYYQELGDGSPGGRRRRELKASFSL